MDDPFRVNWPLVLGGAALVAAVSAATLPWSSAFLSTALGLLMIVGADVDARTYLLPDAVTVGALGCGVLAAMPLEPLSPWLGMASAIGRAFGTAAALLLLRWMHCKLTGRDGLGLGDVKLGAAAGAWLPLEAIPLCFGLAAGAALAFVVLAGWSGRSFERTTKIPLGAFLCPSLWVVFFGGVV